MAFISPIFTRVSWDALFSPRRALVVMNTVQGSIISSMSASGTHMVESHITAPMSITTERNISSGPWWASSDIS